MSLTRRETIGSILLAGLAGCVGSGLDGGDEETPTPIEVGPSGGGVSLVRHHFEYPDAGPELFATLQNTRDAGFELADMECHVYEGDTLLAETFRTISMDGNTTTEFSLGFNIGSKQVDFQSSTRYTITVDVPYENGVTDKIEKEFDQPVQFIETTSTE
ncbi:hypothetical protein [Halobaculum roseum]|uniref:Uncharacterized protein n=1 Tax=Halobaculum roseum TaxID=2175149 RepID=A0ABD5MLM5_9EURY|nr:hypothetical protein [Halobaculum roseum]QZY04229.1 hypothetical protein K6T36_16070 [Halobaculum roseum]